MPLDRLKQQDDEIRAHTLRAIRAIQARREDARTTRALIAEALTQRDNLRGDMMRAFLRSK